MLSPDVLVAAWRPSMRSMPLRLVGSLLGAAAAPLVITWLRGGDDLSAAVVAAALVGGSLVALAAGEAGRPTIAAAPVPASGRLALRMSGLALLLVIVGATVVAIAEERDPDALAHWSARLAELAATAGLGLAVAAHGTRREVDSAPEVGALAGPLTLLVVSALAVRLSWLPSIGMTEDAGRWWQVAAVAGAVAVWQSRDPYR